MKLKDLSFIAMAAALTASCGGKDADKNAPTDNSRKRLK